MSTTLDPARVIGHKVLDADGHKIGQADEVYLDDSTGTPQWVTVKGGRFGGKGHFAPLGGAVLVNDDVRLAYAKAQVDSAPELETGRHLSVEEELTLYQHYGLGQPEHSMTGMNNMTGMNRVTVMDGPTGMDRTTGMTGAMDAAAAPMGTGERDGRVMTRYEERLHVGTERVEAGQARLRKTVTTEQVQRIVPLAHQEIRVEREPIPEGEHGTTTSTADFTEADLDVTLYEERAVVTKEIVAVERVRLTVEEVTEQVTVHEEVRTERIDLVGDSREDPKNRM
ncbi:DUF2382 domain-containing protein [Streptacidiphilus sp. EB103A]|uniref:DUF2382 domain-containing protein n=1 Tax=Streptacidiphilus sp. EB103A TaxID=3156275 RepID=UPI0035133BE9